MNRLLKFKGAPSVSRSAVMVLVLLLSFSHVVRAEIELPEEELAKESVSAKFDRGVTYKNRMIPLNRKAEVGAFVGFNFTEAIENQMRYGLNLAYHFNEIHAIDINYSMSAGGLNTQYTSSLYSTYGLDFTRAPAPQYDFWVHYEADLFYGKLSFTKETVIHFNLYPIVGIGESVYANKTYIGPDVGVGWKFFFNKTWALRTDLKFQYISKPSPFLGGYMRTPQPKPSASQFSDETMLSTIFDVGVVAVF